MPEDATRTTDRATRRVPAPICYHCSSTDTMEPFRRPAEIPLVTWLLPPLRRRYCRTCGRHFLCWLPRRRS